MNDSEKIFKEEYKKLNPKQKEAVDTIDGPAMVVAGPGTGKTQVLALRIANILKKTDVKANGVLCLTFTNSAVDAMQERLVRYIGDTGEKVNVFTFHSFGMKIIEEHFKVLGLLQAPKLLEDTESVIFFDKILNENDWEYLRPRADGTRYFRDLCSLISLLKRDRITEKDFDSAIEKAIEFLENNEDNISSKGESKGKLKKEIQKQIEGLFRSREIVKFIKLYEKAKKEKNVLDYDDVLENLVKIVEIGGDALAEIREKYLYVLVDEHQDSTRVQNEFLEKVWRDLEKPDIFVVGDDRQLIYGFSGASIDHFKNFKKTFPDATLIPLVDNYRSTQVILDASHSLLQSVISDEKLISVSKEHHSIKLIEANNEDEEIKIAGLDIKDKIKIGVKANDCAILVPKNKQVRRALEVLHELGLPISSLEALNLFDQPEAIAFLRVLKIINGDVLALAISFFDKSSGVKPLEAHKFLAGQKMREISLDKLAQKKSQTLFEGNAAEMWIKKILKWKNDLNNNNLKSLIEIISKELFDLESSPSNDKLVSGQEILNTIIGLLTPELEKNPNLTLAEFVSYLERLESYGEEIPLLVTPKEGIKVITMHSSKGLEFDYVWIAHMDERSLSGGKKMAFTLPESIRDRVEERDIDAVKRKLYVAITRAKRFCTLSYSLESKKGTKGPQRELAKIIEDLPKEVFQKEKIRKADVNSEKEVKSRDLSQLLKLVTEKYSDRYVSVSLLNNFFECPWKWYFRNLLQLPEPLSESLEFGNTIHISIDKILKMDRIPSVKELEDLKLDKEVFAIVSRWVKNRLPEIKLSHENEISVSVNDDRFPNLKIYGKIDLIENLNTKNIRVTDFKTGSVRKKSDIEKIDEEGRMSNYLRQLAMYSYLIKQSSKWKMNVSESRLEFLEAPPTPVGRAGKDKKEAFYDRVIQKEEIDLLVADIKDYDEFVRTGEWINRPCNYNSYGKNTECEYCRMAEIYTEK